MDRTEIIQQIEAIKEDAIRRGFDYDRETPLEGATTQTLQGLLEDLETFIEEEVAFNLLYKGKP